MNCQLSRGYGNKFSYFKSKVNQVLKGVWFCMGQQQVQLVLTNAEGWLLIAFAVQQTLAFVFCFLFMWVNAAVHLSILSMTHLPPSHPWWEKADFLAGDLTWHMISCDVFGLPQRVSSPTKGPKAGTLRLSLSCPLQIICPPSSYLFPFVVKENTQIRVKGWSAGGSDWLSCIILGVVYICVQ